MKTLRKMLSIVGVLAIALSLMSAAPPVSARTATNKVTSTVGTLTASWQTTNGIGYSYFWQGTC